MSWRHSRLHILKSRILISRGKKPIWRITLYKNQFRSKVNERTETIIRSHFWKLLLDRCLPNTILLTYENGNMPIWFSGRSNPRNHMAAPRLWWWTALSHTTAKSVSLIISNKCLKSALPYLQGEFLLTAKVHCPQSWDFPSPHHLPHHHLPKTSPALLQDKEVGKETLSVLQVSDSLWDKMRQKVLFVHWWSQKGWAAVSSFKLMSGKATFCLL